MIILNRQELIEALSKTCDNAERFLSVRMWDEKAYHHVAVVREFKNKLIGNPNVEITIK